MPPRIALVLTLGFIVYLFRRDSRQKVNVTGALWIPLLWMIIIGSRFVSQWLAVFGISVGAVSYQEGSPVDAIFFFGLIASGFYVLSRRRVSLLTVIGNNRLLSIFFIYCFIAICWSDFPFVAFKRWIKIVGHPVMVLILLTEPDSEQALIRIMKRAAYIWIPVSILFIKYYPEFGRAFDAWSGMALNTGVTADKNALGAICLVSGYFFLWNLLRTLKAPKTTERRNELVLTVAFLCLISWLLSMAHSSTSLVSLVVGAAVLVFVGLPFVNRRRIGTYIVLAALTVLVAEQGFGVYGEVLKFLGKSPTLTDRTDVWHDVLEVPINPVLGAGFESFWLGERLEKLWAKWPFHPNQAHNGYIETYVNLGLLGLFIMLALLLATFRKARRELLSNLEFGRFRLGFLVVVVFYNWTEATFKALHLVWFVFYIIATDYPRPLRTEESLDEPQLTEAEPNSACPA